MVQFRTADSHREVSTDVEIEISPDYRVAIRYLLYMLSAAVFWGGAFGAT